MFRKFHSWSGLLAALLVVVLAITGAVLSVNPFLERTQAKVWGSSSINVAELTGKIANRYPGAEQIRRSPSGSIIVYFTDGDQAGADLIDPMTGTTIGAYSTSAMMVWVKNLHRSYLLDTPGRVGAGIGAFLMLLLTISGAFMLANRFGGWRHIFRPTQGSLRQRLHCQVGRMAVLALVLSAATGLYMSAVTFELIPEHQSVESAFPENVNGGMPAPIDTLSALKAIPVTELRELVYPYPNDHNDVYSITTHQGSGFVDQSTGQLLSYQPYGSMQKLYEFIYRLHTGEGLWWLGLILGLSALTVPLMAWTGIRIWWERKQSATFIDNNTEPQSADTVILVGSEGNSTWGFAKTLHDALSQSGQIVHTAPMNSLAPSYPQAERLLILTSTYADGDAPASANQFLNQLAQIPDSPVLPYAVLGFGDRQFPQFCRFAKEVADALQNKGWPALQLTELIDRQSSQAFARWGEAIGARIGTPLILDHTAPRQRTVTLQLAERVDYGAEVQAPTSVLRFKAPENAGLAGRFRRLLRKSALPYFEVGDLVGILPPGSHAPRFYSLASASQDGVLEICVRRHQDGLCSGFLHSLEKGGTIEAFIQRNPRFRPAPGNNPVILVGAGTGIGPLAGFIRHNQAHHPTYLYWGGRNPQSDFLYEHELSTYLKDQRLSGLNTAFSRVCEGSAYVQNKIVADGPNIRRLVQMGAQILVCGGRDMAASVMAALDEILAPIHLDVVTLKAAGRYREDVY